MDQTTGSTEPDTEAQDDRSFYEFLTRVGAIDRGGETLTELPVEPVELEAIGLEPGLQPEPGLPSSEPTAPRPSLFARIPKGKVALATVTVLAVMIPTVGLINARGKVRDLKTNVATLKTDIASRDSRISGLNADLATTKSDVSRLQGELTTAQSNATQARNDANDNAGRAATMKNIADGLVECQSGLLDIMSDINNGYYTSALASPAWGQCKAATRAYNNASAAGTIS